LLHKYKIKSHIFSCTNFGKLFVYYGMNESESDINILLQKEPFNYQL